MPPSWAVTPVDARPSPRFSCRVSLTGPLRASSQSASGRTGTVGAAPKDRIGLAGEAIGSGPVAAALKSRR
jgi:hypothetical protein